MKTKIRIFYTLSFLLFLPMIWFAYNCIPVSIGIAAVSFILSGIGKKLEVDHNVRW